MPRLSLYRPEKGNDYKFIDKTIFEMFCVGGTDVLIHKYLGPGTGGGNGTPSQPSYTNNNPFNIQDLLFLENRDRKYDKDVYVLRGVYNVADTDFNLSQFGLFLQNDTIFVSFHINDTVDKIGRKLMSGDVIELPHLKDEYALNDLSFALKRFYVIEEVTRASEGFSVTWYPHLYRAKCKPLVDSQEFKDILDGVADEDSDQSLRDIMSTYEKEMQITQAVLDQAEYDVLRSGYDTSKFYHLQTDSDGRAELVLVSSDTILSSSETPATDVNGIIQYTDDMWEIDREYQVGDTFVYSTIAAGQFEVNRSYTILQVGNTDFRLIGATSNTVGETFRATGTGSGTGIAHETTNKNATKYKVSVAPTVPNPLPPNLNYYEPRGIASAKMVNALASSLFQSPDAKRYDGYITEDGIPANGAPFTAGIAFPVNPVEGQYCLRTDYLPNRLFRYNGKLWLKIEDNLRMTMSNLGDSDVGPTDRFSGKEVRQTQKTSFINNNNVNTIDGRVVEEKQSLSKALRPKADN